MFTIEFTKYTKIIQTEIDRTYLPILSIRMTGQILKFYFVKKSYIYKGRNVLNNWTSETIWIVYLQIRSLIFFVIRLVETEKMFKKTTDHPSNAPYVDFVIELQLRPFFEYYAVQNLFGLPKLFRIYYDVQLELFNILLFPVGKYFILYVSY